MTAISPWAGHIQTLSVRILEDYHFSVWLCAEIECYITGLRDDHVFLQAVADYCENRQLPLGSMARESGVNQFEFRLSPTLPLDAAESLMSVKHAILALAHEMGGNANFSVQPIASEPCSGLHWHLHLANEAGANVFLKHEEEMTPPLSSCLGGLLFTMPALMPCFMPAETSYTRLQGGYDHVPTTVSWGGNNRTVALRLPESVVPVRHIEHRVSGADADPLVSVWAILLGVHYGLTHRPDPGVQIFGRAGDTQYNLPQLPLSASDGWAAFDTAEWLDGYADKAELKLDILRCAGQMV